MMKIIGTTKGGFLLEATEEDIKAALGHDRWAKEDVTGKITNGYEIPISEMFQQLLALRGLRKKLNEASKTLRTAADDVDAVNVPSPLIEEKSTR